MWNMCNFSPGLCAIEQQLDLHIHYPQVSTYLLKHNSFNSKLTHMIIHKLLHLLHFGNITNESLVVHVFAETPQLVEVTDELLTNSLLRKIERK